MVKFPEGAVDAALTTLLSATLEIDQRLADRSADLGNALSDAEHLLMIALPIDEDLQARFPTWHKVDILDGADDRFADSPRPGAWTIIAMITKLRLLADAPDLLQRSLRDIADGLEYEALGEGLTLTEYRGQMIHKYLRRHPATHRKFLMRSSAEQRKPRSRRRGPRLHRND